jgi:hypothetical protein
MTNPSLFWHGVAVLGLIITVRLKADTTSISYVVSGFSRTVTGEQSQPSSPIIVKIIEPAKSELSGLSDVLIGSLGLTGVITLAALLMGVLLAGVMFWVRSRQA